MDELLENLNTILQEKEEKILPENIKKDVEIFGIVGSFEGETIKEESEYNAILASPNKESTFYPTYWLKEINVLDLNGANSMNASFNNHKYLTKISSIINSSRITTMNQAFQNCSSLVSLPEFDTSNVTNMTNAFSGCHSLKEMPKLNTSKVNTFYTAFNNCRALTKLPEFDTSNVTSMQNAFGNSLSLTSMPAFNTSKVTNLYQSFYGCSVLTTIPEWDASKVVTTYNTYYNCVSLTDFGGLKNLGQAFVQATTNNGNYKLDLSTCTNLTHESLMNVINKLYDLNLSYNVANGGTLYTQQLVLGSTNLAKLTADEIRNSNSEAVGLLVNNKKGGNRYEFF